MAPDKSGSGNGLVSAHLAMIRHDAIVAVRWMQ